MKSDSRMLHRRQGEDGVGQVGDLAGRETDVGGGHDGRVHGDQSRHPEVARHEQRGGPGGQARGAAAQQTESGGHSGQQGQHGHQAAPEDQTLGTGVGGDGLAYGAGG